MLFKQILLFLVISIVYGQYKFEHVTKPQNSTPNLIALNDVVNEFHFGTQPFNIIVNEAIASIYSDFLHRKFLRQNNEKLHKKNKPKSMEIRIQSDRAYQKRRTK